MVVGLELGFGFWDPAEGVLREKGLELQQLPPHGELGWLRLLRPPPPPRMAVANRFCSDLQVPTPRWGSFELNFLSIRKCRIRHLFPEEG